MSDDASSQGTRRPAARRYEKPTLIKTDSIIAITGITAISPPTV